LTLNLITGNSGQSNAEPSLPALPGYQREHGATSRENEVWFLFKVQI